MAKNLLLLFDRPNEPVYIPKGDKKISFEVPPSYLPERYQPVAQRILTRFGNESLTSVPIKQIAIPDLSLPLKLSRNANFSLFSPAHRKMANRLIELFLGMRTVDDLLSLAAYCRDRINPQMFAYALSVAILHRPDTKNLHLPQYAEIFPDKFLDSQIFQRAKEDSNILPEGSRIPIEVPLDYTASDLDPEHRVAYWREDMGVNLHHWHWHLLYPTFGPVQVVNKDRRGELFYYMHHQIIARFNIERLCNNLGMAVPLENLREPIPEGYFPKLDSIVAGRAWPARPAYYRLSDVSRPVDEVTFNISDLELARERVYEAIRTRQVRNANGQTIPLDDFNGIDLLGNMVEASMLSPDMNHYGDLHNLGHMAIAYSHDPDHRYLEAFSVMGDNTISMRDPIFYRWHSHINDIFLRFKNSLPAYTAQDLVFPGVSILDISINTPGTNPNTLNTHWTKSDVDLSRGMDFTPRGPVFARLQHLNHDNFSYVFNISNSSGYEVIGTVRVFIAPKYDAIGNQLSFNDQRVLMIEMDKFTTRLRTGQNSITRNSTESALTIPYEATFRDVDQNRPNWQDTSSFDEFNFCGCGWPQHLLVPKGNEQGFPMDMFVMISNYEQDKVDQPAPTGCRDGVSFCGLRNLKYPDARSMGYPFDRVGQRNANSMNDFLTPNMRLQEITVRFNNIIKQRQTSI